MKLLKNAIVYKAELPRNELLAQHLQEVPFTPVGETLISSGGFIPSPVTGELLTPIEGGCVFTVRYDEKILPKAAVKAAITAALAQAEAEDGPLDEDEQGALMERVTGELIAKALVKTTVVNVFYSAADQYLVVPTSSKNLANVAISLLIKACGSVKTSTIHVDNIKGGLTTRLKNHLAGIEDAFEGFKLGESCLLKHKSEKVSFDLANLDHAKQGIAEALKAEMQVERMEMVHGQMSFKLAKDFRITGIDYFGELTEDEMAERDGWDAAMIWRAEASVQLLQLADAIEQLCKVFGYKEPVSDKPLAA